MAPLEHQAFLDRALPVFQRDVRFLGVAAAGSWISQTMDQYSDLDLIVVVDPQHHSSVMSQRQAIVESLGKLLVAFTGEHVGEPRLLICLYADPLLHVDVKFISSNELTSRIENPVVLWERDDALSRLIATSKPNHPMPDVQWIEDRFWVWIHYAALRLGRGELFEVIDFLSFVRSIALGPLALVAHGQLPRGVRRLEASAASDVPDFARTVASYDWPSCASAIEATVALYLRLRDQAATPALVRRTGAEEAAVQYLRSITAPGQRHGQGGHPERP